MAVSLSTLLILVHLASVFYIIVPSLHFLDGKFLKVQEFHLLARKLVLNLVAIETSMGLTHKYAIKLIRTGYKPPTLFYII